MVDTFKIKRLLDDLIFAVDQDANPLIVALIKDEILETCENTLC